MSSTGLIPRDELNERQSRGGIDITAVTRLKHADLLAAAKKFERKPGERRTKNGRTSGSRGGQSTLARKLNVGAAELGRWINLQTCPPAEPNTPRGKWSAKRLVKLEAALFEITGKTLEQLFPKELRQNIQFLSSPKTFERTARIEEEALTRYAIATRERMLLAQKEQIDQVEFSPEEIAEKINVALETLTPREKLVLEMKFGLNGRTVHTDEEMEHELKVTRSYIYQIFKKALRKLREPHAYDRNDSDRTAAVQATKGLQQIVDAVFE